MFLDALAQLADAQAVTSADAYTTNTYDLGNVTPKRRLGAGEKLSLIFVVTTRSAADGGSFTDTCDFMAVQSANDNLSSHDVIIQRRVPAAELVAGAIVELPLPVGRPTKRYIGGRVELGTDDTVSVDAYIIPTDMVQGFEAAYAKNYSV